jgi:retron-type reverse transcriptase
MVKGNDPETLDGISESWIEKTSKDLIIEKFQPRAARRVYIPKAARCSPAYRCGAANGKMRPLGISPPRDKIIQQAMRIVMEEVLEPRFLNNSHGFRPKKGCHSALKDIRHWKGVTWFLEGDIKAFFDSIDHHMLERLINKHFKDARLIHLYWKMVKAGYIEWDNQKKSFISTNLGVPQSFMQDLYRPV